jgi:hypothetical protein
MIDPYLSSQIGIRNEIAEGAVLAVDAVSCTNTFIGVKKVDCSEVGYLFVVLLQPATPSARCAPLFLIEGTSGIENQRTQGSTEKVLETATIFIKRGLIALDGDSSYNQRHHEFMKFWTDVLKTCNLDQVMKRIPEYLKPLPLGDLLHLAKNFRVKFLKYLLSFTCAGSIRSINHGKVLEVLGLGPPPTDLTQVGEMRDCYPLTIMRRENIVAWIGQDATAEAIVLLTLSLCLTAIRLETITTETREYML